MLLNFLIGKPAELSGIAAISTQRGQLGHAVYGDYLDYPAGDYAVEFTLARIPEPPKRRLPWQRAPQDMICAELDVTIGNDAVRLAYREVRESEIAITPTRFVLRFVLDAPGRLQFRVGVSGRVPLLVSESRPVARLRTVDDDPEHALVEMRFPDADAADAPAFLRSHAGELRRLFAEGFRVRVIDGDVALTRDGVSFLARQPEDLFFIGEIFVENTYNLALAGEACVIDIGMNTGLTSLRLARQEVVKEVHSFEPFAATIARARANLAINPAIADKIATYEVALSDRDEERTFMVPDMGHSGAMTIREIGSGVPVALKVRDAAAMLGPIIDAAIARGRRIIVKVDCEGSEFAVFSSLERAGLLERISAFMVEWHRVYDGKSQHTLLDPLLRRGYVTIDRSPPSGNGFFYAVRAA